jgi:hypothetical protein
MAGLSGYVYKFIHMPDGTPNVSMAFFFFIGTIFIIVGFIKVFFKKAENTQEIGYHKAKNVVDKVAVQPVIPAQHRNRIEEQLNDAVQKQQPGQHQNQQHTNQHIHNTEHDYQHSSNYAKTHPYHGLQQGNQQSMQNQATHHAPHTSALSILVCKRCGDKNPATANYCHSCGYRLR